MLLVGSLGALTYVLYDFDIFNIRDAFFVLSGLLLLYLLLEVRQLRRIQPDRWLLNPVVLGSFMTFALSYGISNGAFLLTPDSLLLVGMVPEISASMVKLMALTLVGAIGMWQGYWLPWSRWLCRPSRVAAFQSRFLPKSIDLKAPVLPTLIIVSCIGRLIQIQLGVFGYSSSYERLVEMGAVTTYLAYASNMGKLALLLAALDHFYRGSNARTTFWLILSLGVEVLWGLLSGFKAAVVMPFIIVAVAQYLIRGRVAVQWLLYFAIGIVISYAVIEPFRVARNSSSNFDSTSILSIASTLSSAEALESAQDAAPLALAFMSRSNLSYIGSLGVEYVEKYPDGALGDPEFLTDIILSPLYAWIPRFIWESKPLSDMGLWYTQVVMGRDYTSSTGSGLVTHLYLAGGGGAVFLGFAFMGILQRVFSTLLQPHHSLPGAVVFLGILLPLSTLDSVFDGMLVSIFRELPLMLMMTFILFKSGKRKSSQQKLSGNSYSSAEAHS